MSNLYAEAYSQLNEEKAKEEQKLSRVANDITVTITETYKIQVGRDAFIGERNVGLVVGTNPETRTSIVVVKNGEFKSFHDWQLRSEPTDRFSGG